MHNYEINPIYAGHILDLPLSEERGGGEWVFFVLSPPCRTSEPLAQMSLKMVQK